MIDLFDLYTSFSSFVNTFQGGWFRPQSDFTSACNNISNDLWELYTRNSEKSQEYRDNLIEFLRSKNIITTPQKGNWAKATLPNDYGRYATMRYLKGNGKFLPDPNVDEGKCLVDDPESEERITQEYYENVVEVQIDEIDNKRWGAMMVHLTKGPTEENPKMTMIDGSLRVSPRGISTVILDYYVRPRDAVFAYTTTPGNVQTGAGDQIVYQRNQSLPLQWPTTLVNEFLIRLGERYGLFTRDQFVSQFSTQQKQIA